MQNLLPSTWLSARPMEPQQVCLMPSRLPFPLRHPAQEQGEGTGTERRELDRAEEAKARAAVPQAVGLETGQRSTDTYCSKSLVTTEGRAFVFIAFCSGLLRPH